MTDREKVVNTLEEIRTQTADIGLDRAVIAHTFIDKIIALLKEQEAVKSRKGQWVPIESTTGIEAFGIKEMTVMNVRCSVCGSEEDVSFTGYKYCPRCGAKMEGR